MIRGDHKGHEEKDQLRKELRVYRNAIQPVRLRMESRVSPGWLAISKASDILSAARLTHSTPSEFLRHAYHEL